MNSSTAPVAVDITSGYAEQIRVTLLAKPEGLTMREIVASCSISEELARRALDRLMFTGVVQFRFVHRPHVRGQLPRLYQLATVDQ